MAMSSDVRPRPASRSSSSSVSHVVGTVEVSPGGSGVLHTHPGEEAYYVIDGATVVLLDGKQINIEPGIAKINVRDVPHGALKVTGDKTLKLLTVHIVDKGKPMTVPVK